MMKQRRSKIICSVHRAVPAQLMLQCGWDPLRNSEERNEKEG